MSMTMQKIFDKVYVHLIKQGAKSMRGLPSCPDLPVCAYRGYNGTSCAVGCLIPDEAYTPEMEGVGVRSGSVACLLMRAGVLADPYDDRTLSFLGDLQGIHDGCPVPTWEGQLSRVASKYRLTVPVLP